MTLRLIISIIDRRRIRLVVISYVYFIRFEIMKVLRTFTLNIGEKYGNSI